MKKQRDHRIEATSQTKWSELPQGWKDRAMEAVIAAGWGDTPVTVVAVIATALWDYVESGGD